MKKILAFTIALAFLSVATADIVSYPGNVTATTLGSTLTTDLPEFDSSFGTLTGVTITLDLSLAPYAECFSVSGEQTFPSDRSITYGFDSTINTNTLTHGSDSWYMATPTVGTGTITGTGQTIPVYPSTLKLPGSNSAPQNWSVIGVNLTEYVGTGTLSFETTGTGQVVHDIGSFPVFGGGGADLTGTATVVYEYIPEPATLGLLGVIAGGIVFIRRRVIRD